MWEVWNGDRRESNGLVLEEGLAELWGRISPGAVCVCRNGVVANDLDTTVSTWRRLR